MKKILGLVILLIGINLFAATEQLLCETIPKEKAIFSTSQKIQCTGNKPELNNATKTIADYLNENYKIVAFNYDTSFHTRYTYILEK